MADVSFQVDSDLLERARVELESIKAVHAVVQAKAVQAEGHERKLRSRAVILAHYIKALSDLLMTQEQAEREANIPF